MQRALRGCTAILAAGLIALGAAGCGDDGEASAGSTGGTSSAAAPVDYSVALLSPGSSTDGSWSEATYDGVEAAVSKLGVKDLGHAENLLTPDEYTQQGTAYAKEGANLVLMANGSVPQSVVKVATDYPDATVCGAAMEIPAADMPPNACTYDPEQQEGAFTAGYLAALTSKSGKLGVVAGFAFPALTRQVEGFTLGARYAKPDIEVQQVYINSWTDVAAAKAAAQAQYANGVDIIFSATDSATQGIFAAAQAGDGRYVIASYFDSHDQAPDVVLTSVLYNLQGVTEEMIRKGTAGEIKPESYSFGLDFGVGELAPFYELDSVVPADAKTKLEQLVTDIEGGTVKVPDEKVLGAKGAGASYDLAKLTAG
ncbi:MAG: BMP family protein [Thermoleophilia bacterium]